MLIGVSETLGNAVESSTNEEYEELFDFILTNDGSLKELEKEVKDNIELWLNIGYLELEDIDEQAD